MATATRTPRPSTSANFSSRAVYWMNELRDHPAGDGGVRPPVKPAVGSDWMREQTQGRLLAPPVLEDLRRTHHITNCITFVTDVLQSAYRDVGDEAHAKAVKQPQFIQFGHLLAKYLVDFVHWKAYYWNPDPDLSGDLKLFEESPAWYIGRYFYRGEDPVPAQEDAVYQLSYQQNFLSLSPQDREKRFNEIKAYVNEHSWSAVQAKRTHLYSTIRIADSLTGYAPNPRGTPSRDYLNRPFPPEPPPPAEQATKRAVAKLNAFNNQAKFGFGIARGGTHTFLFASGNVYEVHWSSGPGDWPNQRPLFQVTPLISWGWESGIIVVPPDVHSRMTLPKN